MSTVIRPEVSKKNPFWIEKHRHYELKHFCLQYPEWLKAFLSFDSMSKPYVDPLGVHGYADGSPTEKCVIAREFYAERIQMVDRAAMETDEELQRYILKGVTQGRSYDYLKTRLDIPCCRDVYYEKYREFFWRLDKIRR